MMNQNFLVEIISRLMTKNPRFFKKLQVASVVLGGLSAVVMYLKSSGMYPVPAWLEVLDSMTVLVASVIATVIAQLPNDSSAVK
jgi:Na+/glutamate symporter